MRYAAITERLAGLGSDRWGVHFAARRQIAAGRSIIELTIGEPDVPPDPAMLWACTSALAAGRTGYANGRGEAPLLAALSAKYTQRTGRPIAPPNVLCFPGTQTALFAVMLGLVESGDEVLVGDPLYATYEGVVRASGARMVSVPLRAEHGFRMQADDLETAITPHSRVLLLNSPHNPTGAVLSAADITKLGAICHRHDIWIVSDEVYETLIFGGTFASPLDNADLAARTIVVSSISKSHAAPGFRSGWAIGPVEFCATILPISETMLFGNQPFIADMTAQALTTPSDRAVVMRENYARRARLVVEALKSVAGLEPLMPEAGMFILVDVSATGMTDETFAAHLLEEEAVAVMPGSSFGAQARAFIRISLTVPDERITEACRRIAEFVHRLTRSNGVAVHA